MPSTTQDPATAYVLQQEEPQANHTAEEAERGFILKSTATTPKLDTSHWPLLLKNYDKLLIRSAHYTPIPAGASPLKRDLASYIRSVVRFLKCRFPGSKDTQDGRHQS